MSARDQLDRSTPATLIARAANDLAGRLRRSESRLRRAWTRPLAWVLGQVHYDLRGFLGWLLEQVHPDEAAEDRLDAWGTFWQTSRLPGLKSVSSQIRFTGTPGTPVALGTVIERGDGWQYATGTADVIGLGGTVIIDAESLTLGADGDHPAGTTMQMETAVAGINRTVDVVTPFRYGRDAETDPALRTRIQARIQEQVEAGIIADYIAWAREGVSTLRAAWVVPGAGRLNQRLVYFTVQGQGSASIPTSGNRTAAQVAINSHRPVTHHITVDATFAVPIEATIDLDPGSTGADTLARREAVAAELAALYARRAGDRDAAGGILIINSEVRNAIGRAAEAFTLTSLDGDGTGLSDLVYYAIHVPVVGALTFV